MFIVFLASFFSQKCKIINYKNKILLCIHVVMNHSDTIKKNKQNNYLLTVFFPKILAYRKCVMCTSLDVHFCIVETAFGLSATQLAFAKIFLMILLTSVICTILISVVEGSVNTLIATFNKTLMIYQDVALAWAAQLPHIPVAVKVASFQ